jgi:hypothetical protein
MCPWEHFAARGLSPQARLTSSPTPSTTSSSTFPHTPTPRTPTPRTPHADRGIAPSEDRTRCDACAAVLSVRPGRPFVAAGACVSSPTRPSAALFSVVLPQLGRCRWRSGAPRRHPRTSAADGIRGGVRHANGPATMLPPPCRPRRLCWVDPRSPTGRQPHQPPYAMAGM